MTNKKIEGFGGWLILPLIGLIVSIVYSFQDMQSQSSTFGSLLILFYVITLIVFLAKLKIARWLMIIFLATIFAIEAALLSSGSDAASLSGIFKAVVWAIIWIPYFIFSKRVRNTFVKPVGEIFHKKAA